MVLFFEVPYLIKNNIKKYLTFYFGAVREAYNLIVPAV